MCELCWNADKEEEEVALCPVTQEPYVITFNQLKEEVLKKWMTTGNIHYRVHKNSIFNPPKQSYVWNASKCDDNGHLEKEATLSIQFI